MKFCKDCKFYSGGYYSECGVYNRFDPVTGDKVYDNPCKMRANIHDSCGPEGKLWQAKEAKVWWSFSKGYAK